MTEKRKPGRPPTGERALTKSERQKRWRQSAAAKGTSKVQVTLTLDSATATAIDLVAKEVFHTSRNETIRLLIHARLAQLNEMADVMRAVEDSFASPVFKDSLSQVQERHSLMLRSSACVHDVKRISDGHLKQLETALRDAVERHKDIDTNHVERAAIQVADLRGSLK